MHHRDVVVGGPGGEVCGEEVGIGGHRRGHRIVQVGRQVGRQVGEQVRQVNGRVREHLMEAQNGN